MQRATTLGLVQIFAHGQVEVFAGLLTGEGTREDCGIAFGGHAAVVVASNVAGEAVRQQAFFSILQSHDYIVRPVKGTRFALGKRR